MSNIRMLIRIHDTLKITDIFMNTSSCWNILNYKYHLSRVAYWSQVVCMQAYLQSCNALFFLFTLELGLLFLNVYNTGLEILSVEINTL